MTGTPLSLDLVVNTEDTPNLEVTKDEITSLVLHALGALDQDGSWQVSILFTTDSQIQDMHQEFMGIDSPTDIMTFPYEADEFTPPELLECGGDLVISVDTAAANAIDASWSTADELRYLVLHGLLHLLGWNDTSITERTTMLRQQDELLASWPNSLTSSGVHSGA